MTSYRKLAVRTDRGHVQEPAETYTTKLYIQTDDTFVLAPDSHVIESALELLAKKVCKGSLLDSPRATRQYLVTRLSDLQHEVFGVIWLTARHRVIDVVEVFRGTISSASVFPREIVKQALAVNAASCILFHNHPSHEPTPSQADELITHRLRDALALIECRVLDHVVVAGKETVSFAERGLI